MRFHYYDHPSEFFEILDDDKHPVVSFTIGDSGVEVREQCDDYFGANLNPDELTKLIMYLVDMVSELRGRRKRLMKDAIQKSIHNFKDVLESLADR